MSASWAMCDPHQNARQKLEERGCVDNLRLYPGGREQQVNHHAPLTFSVTDEPRGGEALAGLVFHERQGTIRARAKDEQELLGILIVLNRDREVDVSGKARFRSRAYGETTDERPPPS